MKVGEQIEQIEIPFQISEPTKLIRPNVWTYLPCVWFPGLQGFTLSIYIKGCNVCNLFSKTPKSAKFNLKHENCCINLCFVLPIVPLFNKEQRLFLSVYTLSSKFQIFPFFKLGNWLALFYIQIGIKVFIWQYNYL